MYNTYEYGAQNAQQQIVWNMECFDVWAHEVGSVCNFPESNLLNRGKPYEVATVRTVGLAFRLCKLHQPIQAHIHAPNCTSRCIECYRSNLLVDVCVCVFFWCYLATTAHMEGLAYISAYNVYWMPCEKEINAIILPYIGCLKPEQSARGFVEFFSLAWRWVICKYYMGVENRNECVRLSECEKTWTFPLRRVFFCCCCYCVHAIATKEKGNKL